MNTGRRLCRRLVAAMLLAGSWMGASAQKLLHDTGLYPLYEKLDADSQKVSILHIGDSHVQAGFYPDAVRKQLQDRFGYAGRGFVFPYKLGGTNAPAGYSWSSPQRWNGERMVDRHISEWPGMGGMMLSRDKTAASITYKSDSTFGKLTFWFKGPDFPEVEHGSVYDGGKDLPARRGVYLADSGVTSVTLRFPSIWRFYGGMEERGDKGILYNAIGINGAQLMHYNQLYGMEDGLPVYLAEEFAPDLVIVSLGTNEAFGAVSAEQLKSEMRKAVQDLQQGPGDPVFIFTTPPSGMMKKRSIPYRPKGSKKTRYRTKYVAVPQAAVLRQAIIDFCREEGHACWDLFGDMRGDARFSRAWSHDHVHFNAYGYRLQGELLGKAILNGYQQWQQTIRKN
ncbi:GDSL-type esterase/lipase family protein [Chitinophaga sp.]|uniref:GDSL-type esterase/lipase family protein n=1 Tax=Chitinophaga sp. TaxID=1869181 RepID=UPI002609ACCD|nr:GDSL-type esterase/lipase family protein [uncultured Chitinophaga sp.]